MNIKESGQRQWGRNFAAKGKSKGSLCCCSKEGWYHSWPFTMQDFKDLLIRGDKFSCINIRCLAEPQNFFTIDTFANYGSTSTLHSKSTATAIAIDDPI